MKCPNPFNMDWLTAGLDLTNNVGSSLINIFRDQEARRWQEEMWNRQNEYNSPVNQRKRLEEAGINPNLAFGSSASSGMASNPPSTPNTHDVKLSLGEFYLRKKQIESQIKAQDASVRREDQITEQLRMNNEILSQLMGDKIITDKQEMYVQRIIQGWREDNIRNSLDIGLQTDEQKLDVLKADEALADAKRLHTEQSLENLKQTYNYLEKRYGYEGRYYDQNMNPNETSTPLGFIRYIMGNIKFMIDNWNNPNAW